MWIKNINNLKEKYTNKKAKQMAKDKEFIKIFIFNRMKEYLTLLTKFFANLDKHLDDLLTELRKLKDNNYNYFFDYINFVREIAKLIPFEKDLSEIDYKFLKKAFKVKNKKDEEEWKKNLFKLQKMIVKTTGEDLPVDMEELYNFGNFILSFLTRFDLRKKIITDLL